MGTRLGPPVTPVSDDVLAQLAEVRALQIPPSVVGRVFAMDLDIVAQRFDGPPFDLIVATNVLVYYDVFEQALAAANVAAMLRPGGIFVTNTAIFPTPPLRASASYLRVNHTARRYDDVFWYQRER